MYIFIKKNILPLISGLPRVVQAGQGHPDTSLTTNLFVINIVCICTYDVRVRLPCLFPVLVTNLKQPVINKERVKDLRYLQCHQVYNVGKNFVC